MVGRFRSGHFEISWNQVFTDHYDVKMMIFMLNQSKIDKLISSYLKELNYESTM